MNMKRLTDKNIWKKLALVSISLFLIIVIFHTVKIVRLKPSAGSLLDTSPEQKEIALTLITEFSEREEFPLGDYDVRFSDKVGVIKFGDEKRHVLRVIMENKTDTRLFLIDIDKKIIVESSQIKYMGWMAKSRQIDFPKDRINPFDIFWIGRKVK